MDEFCTYCGRPRGDRISCCGEVHFMSAEEFQTCHGEWPDDGSDEEAAHYDELNRGYAKDRI